MAELPDADMAELPDIDVMRAGFTTNANALNTAAHQLRLAAIANTDIALQVGRLPQAPILQGQAIMALIQQMRDEIRGMREEFRARFVIGSYLLCHIANLLLEITICKLGTSMVG